MNQRKEESTGVEVRYCERPIEIRAGKEGSMPTLVGYASVFNSMSLDLGGFKEQIMPGAFARSIRDGDVRALVNHATGLSTIGRQSSGTLRVSEDDIGLVSEIDLPDTVAGRDILTLNERGDVTQMSFGFEVRAGGSEWSEDEDGTIIRSLSDVRLFEVSIVTFPAYPDTEIAKRSLDAWRVGTDTAMTGATRAQIMAKRHNLELAHRGIPQT